MRVNDQEVTFNVFNALKYPDEGREECLFVRTIDSLVQKQFMKDHEYLEEKLAAFNIEKLIVKEKLELVEEQPAIHWQARKFEPIELTSTDFKENIPSIVKPPKLELKQLPSHLKYVYLGERRDSSCNHFFTSDANSKGEPH